MTVEHCTALTRHHHEICQLRHTAAAIASFTILLSVADLLCGNEHITGKKDAGIGDAEEVAHKGASSDATKVLWRWLFKPG